MSGITGIDFYKEARRGISKVIKGGDRLKLLYSMLVHNLIQIEGYMERQEMTAKRGELIGSCLDIFGQLLGALNRKKGGEIAANLEILYQYCMQKLLEGQTKSDSECILEVCKLVKILKTAWDEVA